ncbi:unnamed protein product [Ambrosiozyma monospora]|uniref:Unnamed protein product n=1 Tax=Ambrosiozyma monospora TaxID=43982 RepID=A0A9W7DK19_AMBMO|nr:unnamed protein product [Ambrosiozyma monospora]
MVKIAIITYSVYGHITLLAREIAKGIESTGNEVSIFRVAETLPQDVLDQIHAPPPPKDIPVISADEMKNYDAFIIGIPTRFGNAPAQITNFFDSTGGLWQSGGLYHKPVGLFTSTSSGGGKETTLRSALSWVTHQGMLYVPLGYAKVFGELADISANQGASPWGSVLS